MLVDYFNGSVCTYSLGIVAQIKNMGAPLLVFAGILYDICATFFWLSSEKYKIMSRKKKSLKTTKISSFSFRLYFIIVGVSSTMYLYSLRSILLYANIDVSRHILVVDTFILAKSNMGRRKYYLLL
jgi:hypothetical protein